MSSRWDNTGAPRGDDYDARWDELAATGHDPHGEAAFVQRFAPQTVLDAGCGTGRVAIELARRGVATVGVDLDPRMLDTARRKGPTIEWHELDLAELDLRDADGRRRRFDVVVAAGNVMIFLRPGSEARVVDRLARHLAPGGRLVAGFQLGATLGLDDYDAAARTAGLELEARYATWDGDVFVAPGTYAVSVHRPRS
jgi:SAM-dependent methyltransferase